MGKESILELQDEVVIHKEKEKIILEKGDKIKLLKEVNLAGEVFLSEDSNYELDFSEFPDRITLTDSRNGKYITSFDLTEPMEYLDY